MVNVKELLKTQIWILNEEKKDGNISVADTMRINNDIDRKEKLLNRINRV